MSNRKRYLDAADVARLRRKPALDPALLPVALVSEAEEEARERRDLWLEGHGG